jgi:hypothetical protein
LEAKLLLFDEGGAVFGSLAAGVASTVLSRGEIAQFEGLGGAEKSHTEAAGDFFTRSSVASHESGLREGDSN